MCALTDPRVPGWLPDAGVAVSALTLFVNLLLMRALDDIRDLDYDRRHNPQRPLARGVVDTRDLMIMIAVGSVFVLAINAWRWPVMCVLAVQLGYAFAVLWVDRRLGWPPGDALVLGFLVSLPVQLLINLYLYAGVLHATGLAPSWSAVAGIACATFAFLHLEFARKTTRAPRPGERTYVNLFGASGTAILAVACAVFSVALLVASIRPWASGTAGAGAVWLAVVPLALPAVAAVRFWRDGLARWPYSPAGLFLLASFAGYQIITLVERMAMS